MAEDVEVTGPVALELYAKSSAVDTDFTAKLVDVWPNGFAQNLTEGILRARYRDSLEKASPYAGWAGVQVPDPDVAHVSRVCQGAQDPPGHFQQ